MSLKDLITNPSGRLSTSDTMTFSTFVVTTFVVGWYTWHLQLPEWMFTAYLLAWAGHNVASKFVAMKRDQSVTPAGGAPDGQ
ncbi:TPA: DUF2644 domain-containing protein [Citrobacter freundii]|nr:DUF2644 domain-containing protein [Escherichia coli]HCG2937286.1 DUF2644 domain-containing protein [Escherichia coli]HCG3100394.1 DUF2644 domain-containing protein [Escherichia coli]